MWAKAYTEGRGPSTDRSTDMRDSDTPSATRGEQEVRAELPQALRGPTGLPAPPG